MITATEALDITRNAMEPIVKTHLTYIEDMIKVAARYCHHAVLAEFDNKELAYFGEPAIKMIIDVLQANGFGAEYSTKSFNGAIVSHYIHVSWGDNN